MVSETEMDREQLGRIVRSAWLKWVKTSPSVSGQRPASWYAEWDALKEEDKECDRQIGEAVKAALESASSPSALIAAVEAVELRIAERSNDDNLPAVTGLLDAEDEWFIKLLRSPPTEEVA